MLGHLERQLAQLAGVDPAAAAAVARIVDEERLHHDRAASRVASRRWGLRALAGVVEAATEAVIWLGMRL